MGAVVEAEGGEPNVAVEAREGEAFDLDDEGRCIEESREDTVTRG